MSTTEEPPNKVRKYEMESQYLEGEVTEEGQEEWLSGGGILTEDGYHIGNQTQNTSVEQDDTTQESQDDNDQPTEDAEQEDQESTQDYQLIQLPNDGQEYDGDGNQEQSMLQNYTLQIQTSQGIIQAQLKPSQDIQDGSQDNITQEYSQENITQEYSQDAENTEDNSTQYIVLPENVTLQTVTDENNTQYFILQETLPDGTVTQQNITAEDLSQYIILQQSLQDGASLGNVSQDNMSQDIEPNDNVQNNAVILQLQGNISEETITQENISQENITQENISQGNVSQDNASQDFKANTLSNIEETLDHFQREESVTPDLPDDLDTYLIRKQLPVKIPQPVVTQNDDDKGNDTDDLLQILGESDNKTKKKVLRRKHNKKQDYNSSDDDNHVIKSKGTAVKRIEAAKNALAKKPAPKAVPETFDKSDEDSLLKKISSSVKITKVKTTAQEKDKDIFVRVENTPAIQQKNASSNLKTTISYADNQPKLTYHINPKVSNIQQKVSNIQPKVSIVQQKVSNIQPKLLNIPPIVSNIQPKISNNQPKISNIEPKVSNIQQKAIYYGGQQIMQQHKLNTIQQKVPQYQQKYTANNQQKTSHQNIYNKKIKQMYQEQTKIIPQRVYNPQKTNAIQQKINPIEQKVNITLPKVNITQQKVNITQPKMNITQQKVNITQPKVNITQQKVNITQPKVNITQQKVNIIHQKVFNQQEKVSSQHKVYGEAKSLDNPSIKAKSLLRGIRANPVKDKEVKEPLEQDMDISVDKSIQQRVMKPEAMDESMSDATSCSDEDSLLDYLPSSDSDTMDDWFNVDIRAERAGDYLPLLGEKAHSILLQEKKHMQSIIDSMQSRLEGVSNTTKRQAEELKKADIALKQLKTQLKTT